jgi:hypothetical protein
MSVLRRNSRRFGTSGFMIFVAEPGAGTMDGNFSDKTAG